MLRWATCLAPIPRSDLDAVIVGTGRGVLQLVDLESGSFQDYLGPVNTHAIQTVTAINENLVAAGGSMGDISVFKFK